MNRVMSKLNDQSQFLSSVRQWRASREQSRRALLNQGIINQFGPGDETGHILMPLSEMLPGDNGHVIALQGEPEVRQHLQEMGFTIGTPIDFVRVAPLRSEARCLRRAALGTPGRGA